MSDTEDDDQLLFTTTSERLATQLMRERHWIDEHGHHFEITVVLKMAATPGREGPSWSVRGRPIANND